MNLMTADLAAAVAASTPASSVALLPSEPLHDLLDDLAEADRADNRLLSLVLCAAAATLLLAAASSLGL
jgi:hypothetical protein